MIWWCAEHSDSGDERYCNIGVRFKSDCRMVEALLIVKDSPQIEIEVQSVHPMSIECYDLPWQSIKSDWRYLLVPLGPVQPEEEE